MITNEECDKDCSIELPIELSELIKACGDRFMDLRYRQLAEKPEWYCCGNSFGKNGTGTYCFGGQTPEEAVSRLYLAIKKQ